MILPTRAAREAYSRGVCGFQIYYSPDCQSGGQVLKDRRLSKLLR
jgi:hypothetical protein